MRYESDTDTLLRPYSRADMIEELGVAGTLLETSSHFRRLQQMGICIVSHSFERNKDTAITEFGMLGNPEVIIAYGAAKFVHDSYSLDDPEAADVPSTKIDELIVSPLQNYLDWCVSADQPYVLSDVFNRAQYSWEKTSGIVFLHDIDPHLEATEPETVDSHQIQINSFL